MHQLHVPLLAICNAGAVQRPPRLLAVVANRDRDQTQHPGEPTVRPACITKRPHDRDPIELATPIVVETRLQGAQSEGVRGT